MWMIVYRNKESGKTIWETGFSRYILNRLAFLSENWHTYEIGYIYAEELSWKTFIGCLFHYRGIIDEESIAAEGKVE